MISIHALRAEGDGKCFVRRSSSYDFYPRPPCGGRQYTPQVVHVHGPISIHALRAEGDRTAVCIMRLTPISIHALRAEGDVPPASRNTKPGYFYPRPPCGGRPTTAGGGTTTSPFLSTPSVRRATRPPHVRRPAPSISIHALRAEGDQHYANMITQDEISIHALRAEGDAASYWMRTHGNDFYPRPPCGGRRIKWAALSAKRYFYPRPPCGGRRLATF